MPSDLSATTKGDKCDDVRASPNVNVTTSNTKKSHIFRFFDLPRELRDRIYCYSHKYFKVPGSTCGLRYAEVLHMRVLTPHLLRVNRQLRQEYEHTLRHDASFRGLQVGACSASSTAASDPMPPTLRARLSHIRSMGLTVSSHVFLQKTGIMGGGANEFGLDLPILLDLMPSLDVIKLDLIACGGIIEQLVTHPLAPFPVSALAKVDKDSELFAFCKDRLANVALHHRLILSTPLFSPKSDSFDEHIVEALGPMNRGNIIFFLASASSGPYTWHGLDLQPSSIGMGWFEKAMEIARGAKKQ